MNLKCALASLLLLTLLTGAAILGRRYVDETCASALDTISAANLLADEEKYEEAQALLRDLREELESRRTVTDMLLHHGYLESVRASLSRAGLAASLENGETLRVDLVNAATELDAIAERDRLTLENIF